MALMGVPHGSVTAKMKMDNVEVSDVNRLLRSLGHDVEDYGSASNSGGKGGREVSNPLNARPHSHPVLGALATGPRGGPNANPSQRRVQLQNIHWNPLPAEKLSKSVWGQGAKEDQDDIQDTDLEELEKLFGSKSNSNPNPSKTQGEGDGAESKKNAMKLLLLEGKRAQNIVIGLAQYKSLAADHHTILRAICSLDSLGGKISADHLENLLPLLPTPSEMKRISDIELSQHPAEVFARAAGMYFPELPRRLQCYLTTLQFRASCIEALDKAHALISACREVISSDRLARLLQKMLAVGNLMNKGTYRGQASGFTVDSLLKMIQTKGSDKKTSLVDYMVKSLYDKKEEKLLDVIADLAVLEGACRLNSSDSMKEFDGLEKSYRGLSDELVRIREKQQKNEALSPQPSAESSSPKKSMSAAFLRQLDGQVGAFALLMEDVGRARNAISTNVEQLTEYFGEDQCETSSIFSVLLQFRRALMQAKEMCDRRERANMRRSQSPPRG